MRIRFLNDETELTLTLNGSTYNNRFYNDEEHPVVIISENAGYCDLQFQDGSVAYMVPRSLFETLDFTGDPKYNRLAYTPRLDKLPLP